MDILITSNGGYVKYGDEVIHKVLLDPEILQEVMNFAHIENHALSFYTEELHMTEARDSKILPALKETLLAMVTMISICLKWLA